ncbi:MULTISPECIES: hypothetical protein [Burkholderia]|nr:MULTISPECIES: hypothetical protein [Burkholderia]MDN7683129.1 hypothetical protein [Burkholderia cenocepacia]
MELLVKNRVIPMSRWRSLASAAQLIHRAIRIYQPGVQSQVRS